MGLLAAAALLAGCDPAGEEKAAATPQAEPAAATPAASAAPAGEPAPAGERFIAIGTEPFWNVVIANGSAKYATPENGEGQTTPVTATKDGNSRLFSGTLGGQPFVLRLRPETCSDGMSDRQYGYAAQLTVAGGEVKGCADPGTELKPG